jgi:hypothetical protein
MKGITAAFLSLLLLLSLAACGTKNYQITTKTGKTFITQGAPEYDMESETYRFTNDEGQEVILNQADVDVMQEQTK